jgi:8-oxo-dGTP diphosphatase
VTVRAEVCVGAIVVYDEELLLIRRGHGPGMGEWSVPGGRVEGGELLAEAVIRETREEAGIEVICGSLVGIVERIHDDRHFVILDYNATMLEKGEPVPGDDAVEARWVPLTDVAELPLVDGLAEFLHEHGVIPTIA